MRPRSWPGLAVLFLLAAVVGGGPIRAADPGAPIRGAPIPGAPVTATAPVTDVYHGVSVTDPYRWLENGTDPKVGAWSAAQNARTRAYLDRLPGRDALFNRILSQTNTASPAYRALHEAGGHLFALAVLPPRQQPLVVAMDPSGDPATLRAVVDPNAIDRSGQTAIDWYVPSPDGRLVAASLSRNGSEDGTVHVFDAATGADLGDPVPRAQYPTAGGSLAWKSDCSGFWYTRYPGGERPEAARHFFQQVFFHRLRSDPATDTYVAGRDLPRIAEIMLDGSQNGNGVLMSVGNGDGGEYAQYVIAEATGQVRKVSDFADQVVAASIGPDDVLYLVSRKNAPRGQLLAVPLSDPTLAHARLLVREGDGVIEGGGEFGGEAVVVTAGSLFLRELVGGPSRVSVYGHDGRPRGTVPLPPVTAVSEVEPTGNGHLLVAFDDYLKPHRVVRYDEATGRIEETRLASTSPVSFDGIVVRREFATSPDGTRVPFTVVMNGNAPRDGRNPLLLYGYGGYGDSDEPRFLGAGFRAWLAAGGIYVDTNLRGGGEYGEAWHRGGALLNKQHVFDDFLAVARRVVAERYTSPQHLAILGGSNGGLLMGAALTQAPQMFRAVVSLVGIYDMMRIELDPNGAFNTTEFGSVKDPAQFRAMLAYSPYQAVRDGVRYPAVFMATGTHDGRVNPAQSRKMIARLQAATASSQPIYLSISDKAGHGIGSSVTVRVGEQADYMAFLFDQLGMVLPKS